MKVGEYSRINHYFLLYQVSLQMVLQCASSYICGWYIWLLNYYVYILWTESSATYLARYCDGCWSYNHILRTLLWCTWKGLCRDMYRKNGRENGGENLCVGLFILYVRKIFRKTKISYPLMRIYTCESGAKKS